MYWSLDTDLGSLSRMRLAGHVSCRRRMANVDFYSKTRKERNHYRNLNVDGTITLKRLLKNYDVKQLAVKRMLATFDVSISVP